jgi:O-antigen/teichoic acid export membrane protein
MNDPPRGAQQQRGATLQSQQIRGSSLLLAGAVLASALDFGGQVLLVRYLAKDSFGAWSYALAVVALFTGIAQFEMRNAAARFIPVYLERGETGKVLGAVALALAVAGGLGVLMATAIVTGLTVFDLRPTEDPEALRLLALAAVLIPIQAVDSVFTGLFAAFGATRLIFLRQSILAPVLRLGVVAVLVTIHANLTFLAIGYAVASFLGVLLYLATFVRVLRAHDVGPLRRPGGWTIPGREVLAFATPMLTSTIVWMLMESSDAILLGYFFGPGAVANFRVVLPLARMNALVSTVFSVLYLPLAARSLERSGSGELGTVYWQTALWMTILTFPVLLLTFSFAPSVTVGLYGTDYAGSAPILALLAMGYFFQTATGFNGLTVKIYGRLRYTVVVDVAAAIANVAINLMLIPRLGPIGAAIGTAGTLLLHNLFKQLGLRRFTQVPWFYRPYARLYAKLGVICVALIGLQVALPGNLPVAILAAAGGGLLAAWSSRRFLAIEAFFPELLRVPLPGWLNGLIRRR